MRRWKGREDGRCSLCVCECDCDIVHEQCEAAEGRGRADSTLPSAVMSKKTTGFPPLLADLLGPEGAAVPRSEDALELLPPILASWSQWRSRVQSKLINRVPGPREVAERGRAKEGGQSFLKAICGGGSTSGARM